MPLILRVEAIASHEWNEIELRQCQTSTVKERAKLIQNLYTKVITLAHSKLSNDFDLEDANELTALSSNSEPALGILAISVRGLFPAGEKPLIDRKFDGGTPLDGKRLQDCHTLPLWNRLDRWQQEAVRRTDAFLLSIVEGMHWRYF